MSRNSRHRALLQPVGGYVDLLNVTAVSDNVLLALPGLDATGCAGIRDELERYAAHGDGAMPRRVWLAPVAKTNLMQMPVASNQMHMHAQPTPHFAVQVAHPRRTPRLVAHVRHAVTRQGSGTLSRNALGIVGNASVLLLAVGATQWQRTRAMCKGKPLTVSQF